MIKEKSVGESNKQLTLIIKDVGKATVFARGAKNQKSKFLSGTQAFCYCDFMLYNGGDFLSVSQIDLIRNFSVFYDDIYKLMYGAYFLELTDKTVMFSQESNDVMRLLLKALQRLEKTECPMKISAAFLIKLSDLLGFCPETSCTVCGRDGSNGGLFYSRDGFSSNNGFTCGNCGSTTAFRLSEGAAGAMSYIKSAGSAGDVFKFDVSSTVLYELSMLAEMIIECQMDTDFKSLEIIKGLRKN